MNKKSRTNFLKNSTAFRSTKISNKNSFRKIKKSNSFRKLKKSNSLRKIKTSNSLRKLKKSNKKSRSKNRYKFSSSNSNIPVDYKTLSIIQKIKRSFRPKRYSLKTSINPSYKSKRKLLSTGYTKIYSYRDIDINYSKLNKISNPNEYLEFIHPDKIRGINRLNMYGFINSVDSTVDNEYFYDNLHNFIEKLIVMLDKKTDSIRYITFQIIYSLDIHPLFYKILEFLNNDENKIYFDTLVTPLLEVNYSYHIFFMIEILLQYLIFHKNKLTIELIQNIRDEFLKCNSMEDQYNLHNRIYKNKLKYGLKYSNRYKVFTIGEDASISLDSLSKHEHIGHANTVLIDTFKKEIEYFEPYGSSNSCIFTNSFNLNRKLKFYFNDFYASFGYKYMDNVTTCTEYSVQVIQNNVYKLIQTDDKLKDNSYLYEDVGYCIIWCLWYIDMRLLNEDVPRKELLSSIEKLHSQHLELSQIVIQNFWTCMRTFLKNKFYHPDNMNIDEIMRCRKVISYEQFNV